MRKIILASHGDFSKGLKHSLNMIVGDLTDQLETYSLEPSASPVDYKNQMEKDIQSNPEMEYIFLCDLKGGSVHNALSQLAAYDNVTVFSGLNMPMAMDLLLSCPEEMNEENQEIILQHAREGITCSNGTNFASSEDEDF